jgi:threonine/homoserine/homoserine lactone efflux protein
MQDHPWAALALFAFVSSITPGPNNLLATASGARFGLRRTLPQVAGVTAGFTVLLWLAASGVAAIVLSRPSIGAVLAVAGRAYLLWMSARLLVAAWRPARTTGAKLLALRPMRFAQSALFQFANPKAWMMAISAASSLLAGHGQSVAAIAALCFLFAAINFPCVGAWAAMGAHLQRWLSNPLAAWRMRAFNAAMGFTMLGTVAWMTSLP